MMMFIPLDPWKKKKNHTELYDRDSAVHLHCWVYINPTFSGNNLCDQMSVGGGSYVVMWRTVFANVIVNLKYT